jgi:hypothetical protein
LRRRYSRANVPTTTLPLCIPLVHTAVGTVTGIPTFVDALLLPCHANKKAAITSQTRGYQNAQNFGTLALLRVPKIGLSTWRHYGEK